MHTERDMAAMQLALQQARLAAAMGEVPVGAVVLHGETVVAAAHNLRESRRDPLAHAEILAIRAAAAHLGRWRLHGCTLVCTLEPCPMCAGAVVHARLDRLVFGAHDARGGAVGSLMDVVGDVRLNHRAAVVHGVASTASAQLLRDFFALRRRPRVRTVAGGGACQPCLDTLDKAAARAGFGSDGRVVEGA